MSDRFQRERWSLFLEFDSFEIQSQPGRELLHPLGEKAAVEAHILETFGGLPEEYAEVVMHHEDGRMEVSASVLDYLCSVMQWVTFHTIPRVVNLVRNEDR